MPGSPFSLYLRISIRFATIWLYFTDIMLPVSIIDIEVIKNVFQTH